MGGLPADFFESYPSSDSCHERLCLESRASAPTLPHSTANEPKTNSAFRSRFNDSVHYHTNKTSEIKASKKLKINEDSDTVQEEKNIWLDRQKQKFALPSL